MEIVSPSHSLECTRSVLRAGADGVYCSGETFHAREFSAAGCSLDELIAIREACKSVGGKYYLVFNAFPTEVDWAQCVEALANLLISSPDAIIISSLGLIRWVRLHYDIPIVVSVLAGTWDMESAEALRKLGASAITISRGSQMRTDNGQGQISLKAIAHGNSCSLVDGTCRLGSYLNGIKGRHTRQCKPVISGDWPTTTPCRRTYRRRDTGRIVRLQNFPVQFQSLSLIPKWDASGVKSLKINGRTNHPDWIGEVVSIYREAVDTYLASPSDWEVRSMWVDGLKALVPSERLSLMPDPIWNFS